jgi:organic hydroperoxide reductase OsmC/OhrA
MEEKAFEFELELEDGYRFLTRFDLEGIPDLITDEPPPIGEGTGPNPSRLLALSSANCLAASLLFCFKKARVDVTGLKARVRAELGRNEKGRLRILQLKVLLQPGIQAGDRDRINRCLSLYEDFCLVTESLRSGIQVDVEVDPIVQETDPKC